MKIQNQNIINNFQINNEQHSMPRFARHLLFKYKYSLLLIISLLIVNYSGCLSLALELGAPPPTLEVSGYNLAADLGKSPIILTFFSTWSKTCKEEIDFLSDLHEQYSKKGLEVIGVALDRKEKNVAKFAADHKIKFNLLNDKKLSLLNPYQILVIPTAFLIDRQGKLKNIYVDYDGNVKKKIAEEIEMIFNPPKEETAPPSSGG